MRTSQGSFAWITRRRDGRIELFTQWNVGWGAFSFVGGHKRDEETFRACLVREVSEELGLAEGEGFSAGDEPLLHAEYTAWSESAKAETTYKHEVFQVDLVEANAEAVVNSAPRNRWLTEDEIYAGTTHDGLAVSPTVRRILSQLPADK
jgi:8-oxo-dGTP pyrophosphatase MutT (NUDIX family)